MAPEGLRRNPEFLRLMATRLLVTLAYQFFVVAAGWHLYGLTGRALDLGYAGLAAFLPKLLLTMVAGAAADRYPKLLLMQGASVVFAAGTALLAVVVAGGRSTPADVYAALILVAAARAFYGPANSALLPLVVSGSDLTRAIAVSSTMWQISSVGGPAAAGLLYALPRGNVVVFAVSTVLLSAAVWSARRINVRESPPAADRSAEGKGWQELLGGITFLRENRLIYAAIALDLFAVLLGGAVALLPVFAKDVLHLGPTGFGVLRAAPAVGAAVVAVRLAGRPLRRRAGPWMLGSVFLFGLATIVFGVSRSFALSLAALALTGAFDMVSVVVRQTLIQLRTPQHLRGRVSAVSQVFIGASNELGEFESGVTAHWFGPVAAVVTGGVGTCLVVLYYAWRYPELRRVDRIDQP